MIYNYQLYLTIALEICHFSLCWFHIWWWWNCLFYRALKNYTVSQKSSHLDTLYNFVKS